MPKLIVPAGLAIALISVTATPAAAYIGPGAGAGLIAVVLGVLASIAMAFAAILWYPVKRLVRRRKDARRKANGRPVDQAQ